VETNTRGSDKKSWEGAKDHQTTPGGGEGKEKDTKPKHWGESEWGPQERDDRKRRNSKKSNQKLVHQGRVCPSGQSGEPNKIPMNGPSSLTNRARTAPRKKEKKTAKLGLGRSDQGKERVHMQFITAGSKEASGGITVGPLVTQRREKGGVWVHPCKVKGGGRL